MAESSPSEQPANDAATTASVRPMTPDEVLAVLERLQWRDSGGTLCAKTLTLDSPVTDLFDVARTSRWFGGFDDYLADCRASLNNALGTSVSENEFTVAVLPLDEKKVGDLCRLYAEKATVAVVEPPTVEGTLATIANLLAERGVERESIGPSSSVGPYVAQAPDVFRSELVKLSPKKMPLMVWAYPWRLTVTLTTIMAIVLACSVITLLAFVAALAWGGSVLLNVIVALSLIVQLAGLLTAAVLSRRCQCEGESRCQLEGAYTMGQLAELVSPQAAG